MKTLYRKIIGLFKKKSITKYILIYILIIAALVIIFIHMPSFGLNHLLSSFTGALMAIFTSSIYKFIDIYREDYKKINKNLDALITRYSKDEYLKTLEINNSKCEFLYDECLVNNEYELKVEDDPQKMFEVDVIVKNYYLDILKAHTSSYFRNEPTVRLDDYKINGNTVYFYTSRSNYLNHMVTNRAMDYPIRNTASIRALYEYKSKLTPLHQTKMSNHIGINALVFLNDGTFLMPLRSSNATISKRLVTSGIATRLITDDYDEKINEKDIFETPIINALNNKLFFNKIKPDTTIHFLGFGRDIYEGGKPQFYFVVYINNCNSKEYLEIYKKVKKRHAETIDLDRHIFLCKRIKSIENFKLRMEVMPYHILGHRHIRVTAEHSFFCNYYMYKNSNFYNS
ncbi:MAG: hypothetical protein PHT03_08665 [Bacilli bacterium]|nr:hypothetical protein [Bacilli bacterium]